MKVITGTKDNFKEEVLKGKVLVDFNATWCGPCRMLKPIIDEIAENNNEVKIVSIDIDEEDDLAAEYNVFSIPCLVLFNEGKEVKRSVGFISKEEIETLIGE